MNREQLHYRWNPILKRWEYFSDTCLCGLCWYWKPSMMHKSRNSRPETVISYKETWAEPTVEMKNNFGDK